MTFDLLLDHSLHSISIYDPNIVIGYNICLNCSSIVLSSLIVDTFSYFEDFDTALVLCLTHWQGLSWPETCLSNDKIAGVSQPQCTQLVWFSVMLPF